MIRVLPFVALVAAASCVPISPSSENEVSVWKTVSECLTSGHSTLCFKERALRITDRLRSMKQISVIDGITLANAEPTRAARSSELAADPAAREAQVEESIVDNVEDILRSTVVQFRLPGASEEESSLEEGRGKKKKLKKKLLLVSLILKAKLFLLVPLFLGIIAFTLLKSIILAKIAFVFAAVTLIKKLLASKQSSSTTVWAAPAPAPAPAHTGWSSGHQDQGWENQGWDRSKVVDAQTLAYSGQIKA